MAIGYLYVTTDRHRNMAYVGQSTQLDSKSVSEYLGSGDLLLQAIAREGPSNFNKTVLSYFDDQDELDYQEIRTIAEQRSQGVDLYNSGVGGALALDRGHGVGSVMPLPRG
jgi:hypothetical protein